MTRILKFAYGVIAYVLFLFTFLYLVGFVGNVAVPRSIALGGQPGGAVAWVVDTALLALFMVQHSVMARPAFKRRWVRIVPAAIERSTYVLVSSAVLLLLFWQWRPLPAIAWDVDAAAARAALHALFVAGWAIVLLGTFMVNHFDLFGLRQVWIDLHGRRYSPTGFLVRGLYRWVRHPLMLGFLVAFWSTPTMTVGQLLFATAMTAYVLVAIRFEERDLVDELGERYAAYRETTPALIPSVARRSAGGAPSPAAH